MHKAEGWERIGICNIIMTCPVCVRYLRMSRRQNPKSFASLLIFITCGGGVLYAAAADTQRERTHSQCMRLCGADWEKYAKDAGWHHETSTREPLRTKPDRGFNDTETKLPHFCSCRANSIVWPSTAKNGEIY